MTPATEDPHQPIAYYYAPKEESIQTAIKKAQKAAQFLECPIVLSHNGKEIQLTDRTALHDALAEYAAAPQGNEHGPAVYMYPEQIRGTTTPEAMIDHALDLAKKMQGETIRVATNGEISVDITHETDRDQALAAYCAAQEAQANAKSSGINL